MDIIWKLHVCYKQVFFDIAIARIYNIYSIILKEDFLTDIIYFKKCKRNWNSQHLGQLKEKLQGP